MTGQREVEGLCKRLRTSLNEEKRSKFEPDMEASKENTLGQANESEMGVEDGFGEDAAENDVEFVLSKGDSSLSRKDLPFNEPFSEAEIYLSQQLEYT